MLVVRFKGGLGNQLFQWAFAHTFDSNSFYLENHNYRSLDFMRPRALEILQLSERCGHMNVPSQKLGPILLSTIMNVLARSWEFKKLRKIVERLGYLREDTRDDYPSSSKIQEKRIAFLDGYFQDVKYVKRVSKLSLEELQSHIDIVFSRIMREFQITESYDVIHVRRPDKREMLYDHAHIGAIGDSWFLKNFRRSTEFVILLTEDRTECEFLIEKLQPSLILDSRNSTPWEALAVMARASSGIGCNSSLSWWGAYLSVSQGGVFTLPANWSWRNNVNNSRFYIDGCRYEESIWMLP